MQYTKEILNILKDTRSWSEEEILNKLKISKKTFYDHLLFIVLEEIKKLDFDTKTYKYKYLYKIFKYFEVLEDKYIINECTKKLKKVDIYLNEKIKRAIKQGNENISFDNVISKLIDIVGVTLLKLEFDPKDKEQNVNQNNRNYMFLCELIYNVKNYDYVYEVFKTSKHLMYTTNNEGKLLIEELIEHYIKCVMEGNNHYDIIYFEKIIKIFLNSKKFIMEKECTLKLINKLLNHIDNLKRTKLKKREIERIKFFLEEIIKDLKNINAIKDYNELSYKYGIIDGFSDEALLEAKTGLIIDNNKYIDYRDKFTITIDSPGTKVYDDACFFEQLKNGTFLLGVFVSDVDAYLKPHMLLDKEAYQKAENIYLINHHISMLPYELIDRISLNQSKDRLAIGYFFTFDPQMNLIDFQVKRSLINIKYNLDYNDVSNLLTTSSNIELFNTLKAMIKATEHLKEKQIYDEKYQTFKEIKRSVINPCQPEFKNGEASIFSTFSILMNNYVASFFSKHPEIPFPYHVNLSKYDDYIIRDLKTKLYNNESLDSILSCLNEIYVPSFYSTDNLGHNGLNLKSYSNASNPLRQYISLVTERLVKYHIIDCIDYPIIDINNMNAICEYINNKRSINEEYRQEFIKCFHKRKYH